MFAPIIRGDLDDDEEPVAMVECRVEDLGQRAGEVDDAHRVFGGINGDVLGAVIEVGLGTLLVVLTVGIAS